MNVDLAPPPIPKIEPANKLPLQPGFLLAWRGIWLFTWRSQLNWRRLPAQLIGLLVLPILVYVTTTSPKEWSESHSFLGNARMQVNEFASRLKHAQLPLRPEQQAQLYVIFKEEFARSETQMPGIDSTPLDQDQWNQQIRACHERIRNRVQPLLEPQQFTAFQNFQKRTIQLAENRASEPAWNWTAPFYHWLTDFYFFIILPLSCVQLCGGVIRNELQTDTLGFLTTRPVSRARLVILKYLAQTAWLQILLCIETLLLFAAGSLRNIPAIGTLLPLLLATQILAVFAWSALGLFFGQLSNRYIALALVYGAIVELGIGRIPTNINTLSIMRHLKTLLAHNPALQGVYEWNGTGVALSIGALVLAPVIFLGLSALLFTFREYHHTAEMQK
ncbi:MAG: ABC transporter permease [Verrucomicrobiota bacterium]